MSVSYVAVRFAQFWNMTIFMHKHFAGSCSNVRKEVGIFNKKFTGKSNSDRILKLGQQLAKLWANALFSAHYV